MTTTTTAAAASQSSDGFKFNKTMFGGGRAAAAVRCRPACVYEGEHLSGFGRKFNPEVGA